MRVSVVALDGIFDTGLAAVLDTLTTANELAAEMGRGAPPFAVRVVGLRRRARTFQGFHIPVAPPRGPRPDMVVVPALGMKTPEALAVALERPDVADAERLLAEHAAAGAWIGAACTGTFVLAATSLLDGRTATTTWWLAPAFRELYPRVTLEDRRMIVESGRLVTAGAALAHLDLALWIVRRISPELASVVARYLVVDARPSQALYAIPDHLAHTDPMVERFEGWARRNLGQRFSLSAAARSVGASERTLARRLRAVLGKSPLSYVQDLRVERAIHLLKTSAASVDEIATQVGYGDGVTLRTLLRRKTGRGVRELRANV
ncbi:MAG TPA: helix-turn-helix domain-containing protein [Haliangiales bacterium]|nr:helix-turn-helix domain-containing protein [Haliangiales bacterium]